MRDLTFLVLVGSFFALATGYIGACARLSATSDRDLDLATSPDTHPQDPTPLSTGQTSTEARP